MRKRFIPFRSTYSWIWKRDNKVTYSNHGCFSARIPVPQEHTKMDWNNPDLKCERPRKMRGITQGSAPRASIEHVAPEQSVKPITVDVTWILKRSK